MTYLGCAFIAFFVPETKCHSLEEMDVIFGSVGTASTDAERLRQVNKDIGLDAILSGQADAKEKSSQGEGSDNVGDGMEISEVK